MTMNHINLPVVDVAANRAFFERHFGFRCIVEKGADTFVGLIDGGGMVLAFSNFKGVDHVEYPEWFHVGFMQRDDAKVDEVFERLKAAGVEVERPKDMHGAWTFYFQAPGGFTVEVSHQRDQDVFSGLSR